MALITLGANGLGSGVGGSLIKLSSATISNDASVIFDNTIITSAYKTYKVIGANIVLASDDHRFECVLSTDNGSTNSTSGNAQCVYESSSADANSTATFRGGAAKTGLRLTGVRFNGGNATAEKLNFEAMYHGLPDSSSDKFCTHMSAFSNDSGTVSSNIGGTGTTNITSAVNNIKFQAGSGNLSSGTITIYGVKE